MDTVHLRQGLILLAVALTMAGREGGKLKPPWPAKARVDLHGDPLPAGAVARLGTVRFGHAGAVRAVAFSDDGKLLAASSDARNMVVLWDRATGRKLREIPVTSVLPPTHLRFSSNGKQLYASWYGQSMELHAWDVATGAVARDLPRPPKGALLLADSPNTREFILLHNKNEIVRWDVEKGKERGRYPTLRGHSDAVAVMGERLLVAHFDGQSVGMWDAAQKKQLWSVQATRETNYPGLPMAYSADGKLFAVEAQPRVISVYRSITGKVVQRLKGDVGKIYYSLCISPDARHVAGSNWDGSLRLWDLATGRQPVKVPAVQGWVTHVFFAPDAKTFATGGPNNAHAVLVWETATGKPIDSFPGHSSPVSAVAFSPDGRKAATSSWIRDDPVVRLWGSQTGRLLRAFEAPNVGGVSAVAFSPDGRLLAGCRWSGENQVRIWDAGTGRQRYALAGHDAGCTCVAFSPDGKRLASGDAYHNRMGQYEGRVCIWDTETGKRLREIRGTRGAIQRVLFTCDGRHVLVAADGVHVYDSETGQPASESFQVKCRVWDLALSADGRLLATADGRGQVRLWELATRREVPLGMPAATGYAVDLTPDGRTLVVGGPEGAVVLFHWPSGQTVGRLAAGGGNIARVVLSPDARLLATPVSVESSALVWDVAGLVQRPLPAVARPAEADLRRWWAELRDDKPGVAYRAVWRFVAAPAQALPFLAATLRPVKVADQAAVARLIDDLDSPQFPVREKASRELERLDEAVVEALRKAKRGKLSAEQMRRIDRLLARLAGPVPDPESLRASRAVAVLEQIGSSGARKVLTPLAAGAAGARQTREAKAALERLDRAAR
jgi:WD40 repeat protein